MWQGILMFGACYNENQAIFVRNGTITYSLYKVSQMKVGIVATLLNKPKCSPTMEQIKKIWEGQGMKYF